MGFIQKVIEQYKKKVQERNDSCNLMISRIDNTIQDARSIFSSPLDFIDPSKEAEWKSKHENTLSDCTSPKIKQLKKAVNYRTLLTKQNDLLQISHTLSNNIRCHNEQVAKSKIAEAHLLIKNVEGRTLDNQQMTCIVKEAHNHLVIAGAGTGKTTTVIGKIKYLLSTEKCSPQDILVLSFTNASASEMSERIFSETGHNIAASTFHKLGLTIITQVNGVMPVISQLNLKKFIADQLALHMQSDAYLSLLSSYFLHNKVYSKSEFDFKTQAEYNEYLSLNPPTTVNHEIVKSYGEMDIANFLEQNGIRYVYEHPYEFDTRSNQYGQYHPDFYLPDHNIYIEYFGINRKQEVPSYFSASHGMTATEAYRASMEWKRSLHKEKHTLLIECYAYEKLEGILLESLKEKLINYHVPLRPKSAQELWAQISEESNSLLDGLIELFETLINLIKSNGYDICTVRNLNTGNSNAHTNNILLTLLSPIFNAYCKYLSEHNEIDFNDMINLASSYVNEGRYVNPYSYVIVDEYQDISKARFKLLYALRKSHDYKLFCVGDDWQSIYRFAGSDIGFILRFNKYWGPSEVSKIETTYRFSQKLIEISGTFVMQNPLQVKKSIRGKMDSWEFPYGEISGYTDEYAISFMNKQINDLPENSSVFFIGRYSFDATLLRNSGLFECQYNNTTGFVDVKSAKRPDLKMSFLTAHKSKGLQADYVFIINNKKTRMGFPSKIQDAPILELLLDNCDGYPHAEERRLFYVAITRAKHKVFLVTVNNQESEFALELRERYGNELKKTRFTCPICGGQLIKRSGPYGNFLGCSNYRKTGCKFTRKTQ